ncbi:hypothetical protein TW80_16410 [Loktanella sp. S4079]|nr:hypothetical protein TW80_16410 [Loktanella sp. S4079]
MALAEDVLELYGTTSDSSNTARHDAGPVIAAALLLDLSPSSRPLVERAIGRWLSECPDEFAGIGPFGGLSGFIAALRCARRVSAKFEPLYRDVCDKTRAALEESAWKMSDVVWRDYDYFTGPSGAIIAGADTDTPREVFQPALDHLFAMCATPEFEAFRGGNEIDPRSAFNIGRINAGLGHGLAGVAAAMVRAIRVLDNTDETRQTLRKLSDWLMDEVITDDLGLVTWPPVGRDGGPSPSGYNRRQAWCYGAPGNAWVLYDASTILNDDSMRALSQASMQSFCDRFDHKLYIDDAAADESLSICHGAAGTLALADTFARHADMPAADTLRKDLTTYLLEHRAEVLDLAASNMSLLSGAGGILSVLLTSAGADRNWLSHLTLR